MLIYIVQGSQHFLDLNFRQTKLITGKLLKAHPCPYSHHAGHGGFEKFFPLECEQKWGVTSGPESEEWVYFLYPLPPSTCSKDSGENGTTIVDSPESLKDCVKLPVTPTVTGMRHETESFIALRQCDFSIIPQVASNAFGEHEIRAKGFG